MKLLLDVTDVALYTRHWVRQIWFNEQFGFSLLLHLQLLSFVLLSTLELFCFMFSMLVWWYINNSASKCFSWTFYGIAVLGEVLPQTSDEQFTNICLHILAIWWFEPYSFCFYFFEHFDYCYYWKTLMKNVHYTLVTFHRQIQLCQALAYHRMYLKLSCWSF